MDMEKLSRAVNQARVITALVEVGLLTQVQADKVKAILGKKAVEYLKEELIE